MSDKPATSVSRRRFLKTAGATVLATGAGPAVIIPGRAQPKTLKIVRFKGTVSESNRSFLQFAQTWGEKNDIEVIVDLVGMGDLDGQIIDEAKAQKGHDLVIPSTTLAEMESYTIDHREIYEELEHRFGTAIDHAIKTTYNPKTKRFWGVLHSFTASVVNYRKDLWDTINRTPNTWEDVLLGGRQLRLLHDRPLAIDLSPALGGMDNNLSVRALLYSFGGKVQNADSEPALQSKETLEALKFAKALYEQAMPEDALNWDGWVDNNRLMLSGESSLTINALSITRTGENKGFPVTDNIWLAPPPLGPSGRLCPDSGANTYFIWKFTKNVESAKQFLVDYMVDSRKHFIAAGFSNYPAFPQSVPDMNQIVGSDLQAKPIDKYKLIVDAQNWNTNIGYPGYLNRATSEVFRSSIIPKMFSEAISGKMTPKRL